MAPAVAFAGANPVVDALAAGAVVQFTGNEAVSQTYEFDVTIATTDKNLTLASAVGQPVTIPVAAGRAIVGMIERIEQVDGAGAQGLYRLRIVSSMNRLKYRITSRTFYNKKVSDIVLQILNEAGVSNVELRLTGSLEAEAMTMQYQETDFAFMSRILESAGIHYHVETTSTGEKVVLSDGNTGFPPSPVGKLVFGTNNSPAVNVFSRSMSLHSGQIQVADYNWQTPDTNLTSTVKGPAFLDLMEGIFPGGVETASESEAVGNVRLAARMADAQTCAGESSYPQLQAGQRLFLANHPRADFNQEYVIIAVTHQRTGKEYRNSFRCLPVQVAFRPLPVTPVPIIAGVVPAVVHGPPGETKFVDKYGRIKVRFPWRAITGPPGLDGDAGFVRVAQIATGTGASAMWLPDVGDEVLVAFEHGDPRRPVVVGSMYNARDMPPVALPANKHLSILRQQGANGNRTELVYDGTPGNERLFVQSGPTSLTLASGGGTQVPSALITSTGDVVQKAGRVASVESTADVLLKSGQNISVSSQKDAVITVTGNSTLTTGAALKTTVGADAQITIAGNASLDTAKDLTVRAGQNFLLQSAGVARLTTGLDAVIQTGRSFVTSSAAMFEFVATETGTFKTGNASYLSKKDGSINIVGRDIAITGNGTTTVRSAGELFLKGSKILQN
jgi:type VI secretion system secreted protein VgrG